MGLIHQVNFFRKSFLLGYPLRSNKVRFRWLFFKFTSKRFQQVKGILTRSHPVSFMDNLYFNALYQNEGLTITENIKLRVTDLLSISLNPSNENFSPFKKPNSNLLYNFYINLTTFTPAHYLTPVMINRKISHSSFQVKNFKVLKCFLHCNSTIKSRFNQTWETEWYSLAKQYYCPPKLNCNFFICYLDGTLPTLVHWSRVQPH